MNQLASDYTVDIIYNYNLNVYIPINKYEIIMTNAINKALPSDQKQLEQQRIEQHKTRVPFQS